MFRKTFHPDSGLMITLSQISDVIFMSLFYIVCSVPLITLGASTAALYDGTFRGIRQNMSKSFFRYFETFKKNFRPGLIPGLLFAVGMAGVLAAARALWNAYALGQLGAAAFGALAVLAVIVLGLLELMLPMLSRFELTTGQLLRNTLLMGLAHVPLTLLLGVIHGAGILCCLFFVWPVFFIPGLCALLGSFCIEPMFKPYLPREEA